MYPIGTLWDNGNHAGSAPRNIIFIGQGSAPGAMNKSRPWAEGLVWRGTHTHPCVAENAGQVEPGPLGVCVRQESTYSGIGAYT